MTQTSIGRTRDTATTLKTVERALDVLEAVADAPQPPQIRQIAAAIDHNLSSTYHIVNTLLLRRYLERDEHGRLGIGPKLIDLSSSRVRGTDLLDVARPVLARLAETSDETVYLTRYAAGSVIIQAAIESTQTLRVTSLPVGHSGAEDRRASGKAVLAHLTEPEQLRILRGLHPQADDEQLRGVREALGDEFAQIRTDGYAFESESYEPGVCCIAAPFFLADGSIGGSVSISAPTLRISHLLRGVRDELLAATSQITSGLGGGSAL